MHTNKICSQRLHRKKKAHHFFCCLINRKCEEGSGDSALGEDVNSKVVTLKIYVWENVKMCYHYICYRYICNIAFKCLMQNTDLIG